MSTRLDTLNETSAPDRLAYQIGLLLGAEDLEAEQRYHRGMLGRALRFLHGHGTAAGLEVRWQEPLAAGDDPDFPEGREEEIVVRPGLAVDRIGRIIEVPRQACIRLSAWLSQQPSADLAQAFHTAVDDGAGGSVDAIVADVFVRYVVCERGKTPAFAEGPFEALDALAPSRLRDGYELRMFLRRENPLPVPESFWPANAADVPAAIFEAWDTANAREQEQLAPLPEHIAGQDSTFVLLGRILIPAAPGGDGTPERTAAPVVVFNLVRRFVYATAALGRLSGLP